MTQQLWLMTCEWVIRHSHQVLCEWLMQSWRITCNSHVTHDSTTVTHDSQQLCSLTSASSHVFGFICIHKSNTHTHTHIHVTAVTCNSWWVSSSLQHSATRCNTLQRTATHCDTLQHAATHCNTLPHIATHCNTLQHTATHCNTLQRTAIHFNTCDSSHVFPDVPNTFPQTATMQHTATHCNTLQHTATHVIHHM